MIRVRIWSFCEIWVRRLHPDLNTPPFGHEGHYAPIPKVHARMAPIPFSLHRFLLSVNAHKQHLLLLTLPGNFHQDSSSFADWTKNVQTWQRNNVVFRCHYCTTWRMYHLTKQYIFASTRVVFFSWPSEITSFCFTEFIETCHEENPYFHTSILRPER